MELAGSRKAEKIKGSVLRLGGEGEEAQTSARNPDKNHAPEDVTPAEKIYGPWKGLTLSLP